MFATATNLEENVRKEIAESLNASLIDGLDLFSQIKLAHWNIKGPHFAALHPFFDTLAAHVTAHIDEIAERAVALGLLVSGTARQVASGSRIPEYAIKTTRDIEHVKLLAERFAKYMDGLRGARSVAEKHEDEDTTDLLTQVITECEKDSWMLMASTQS
jgi:starvation-inducible DNA-binding protein